MTNLLITCTRCTAWVRPPIDPSVEVDPLCEACLQELQGCPGFNVPECGNPTPDCDLCGDCTRARLDYYF